MGLWRSRPPPGTWVRTATRLVRGRAPAIHRFRIRAIAAALRINGGVSHVIIHRNSHMTNGRVEVITSVERWRRWNLAEKEQLVAASLESSASVSSRVPACRRLPEKRGFIQASCMVGAVSCVHGRESALRRCRSLRMLHPPVWPMRGDRDRVREAERGCRSRAQSTRRC